MSFPNEVYEILSTNSEMKRFLHVVKDNDENSYDYMKPIGELTSYYNFTLLQKVKRTNHTPDCTSLPKGNLIIYRKMKFIEDLIFQLRIKHRQKMIDFSNSVLEFLIKWKKSDDGMIIHVNLEELKTYLVADPISVVILLNKFNFYASLIQPILNSFSTRESVQNELIYVIEDISKSLIKRTSFFPIHRLQDKFEVLFLSPLLPFKEKLDDFIKEFPPQDSQFYLQELFSFVISFFSVIKISQKPFDSTLVLLIIRLLFDKIYERNVYLTTMGQDILQELSHITAKEFAPPSDFSPPYTSDSISIIQLFRNDKYFSKAVLELENIVFYNNPFDLLNCVDSSLSVIEKSATVYNNYQTMVFPFEVTFELFMAVVIASQIPNWENISKLVTMFTPNVGLCPSFEFSKAKIAASVMQFRNMIDEMHDIDVNDNKERASDYLENASKNCENKEETTPTGILSNFVESSPEIENINTNQNSIENANNSQIEGDERTTIENSNEIHNQSENYEIKNDINNSINENHEQNKILNENEDNQNTAENQLNAIKSENKANENDTIESTNENTESKDTISENKAETATANENETTEENQISEDKTEAATANENETAEENQINENKAVAATANGNETAEENQISEDKTEAATANENEENGNTINENKPENETIETAEENQTNENKDENAQNEATSNENKTGITETETAEVHQVNESKIETTTEMSENQHQELNLD